MTITLPERTTVETAPVPVTLAGALHPHCRCMGCRLAYAEWQRTRRHAIADGTWQPLVDATEAREHIEHLHRTGMSYNVIARLAKLHTEDIQRVRTNIGKRPRSQRIRPDTAAAILAVQLHYSRLPGNSKVPSLGAIRRVQALRAIGWPSYVLSTRIGLGEETTAKLLRRPQTTVATHLGIAALYEELRDQNPVEHGITAWIARRNIHYAAGAGWAVPAAWSDIDTDEQANPRIRGLCYAKRQRGERGRGVIDDTAELAAEGLSRAVIAERIGIAWNSIEQTHLRAGVDLPVQLRQEHASEAATPDRTGDP